MPDRRNDDISGGKARERFFDHNWVVAGHYGKTT
jgi:hypothetical protein